MPHPGEGILQGHISAGWYKCRLGTRRCHQCSDIRCKYTCSLCIYACMYVISQVALQSWLLVFTKRDQSKALDFVHSLKRITNSMGIRVSSTHHDMYTYISTRYYQLM